MLRGRWFSTAIGLMGAGMTALLLLLFRPLPQADAAPPLWSDTARLLAAAAVGVILGTIHAVHWHRHLTDLRRLADHVDRLGRPGAPIERFAADPLLDTVALLAERSLGQARTRAEQLQLQRREFEVQLRISESQRRHATAILNSIADAVLVTDAFNEIVLANTAAARVLGCELSPMIRQPVDQVIADAPLVKLIRDMREASPSVPGLRRQVEHRRPMGGRQAVFEVTLSCLADDRGPSGEAAGVVTILRDITREKEIAEMKSDFVSNVSHELRTPLSSIKAYVEMLVDGEAADEQTRSEFYNIIQGETNRLQRLIDNILNINRIESGIVKVQREHLSLPDLVREVVDVMQPQARAKRIELSDEPCPVRFQTFADRDMVYQAVLNLVGNAVKYTGAGGRITLRTELAPPDPLGQRMVTVSVADTGVGVPDEALPHLFEKFYRVPDHKKLAAGTGLGLNLVKQIIETVHGGRVSVRSRVGEGSTFTFSLPMAEESRGRTAPAASQGRAVHA